jgi:hypothetical protein
VTDGEIQLAWLWCEETWTAFRIPEHQFLQEVRLKVWRDVLGDLDADLVQAALASLAYREFPPAPGKVREQAQSIQAMAIDAPRIPDVDEAMTEMLDKVRSVGRYATPEWSHPAIASAVSALGWEEICNSTEPGVLRGQFAKVYGSSSARHRVAGQTVPPALATYLDKCGALGRADEFLALGRAP